MRIAFGRVVGGRVELDGDLPEGASVARRMNPRTDRIEVNPRVMLGKPVIHGTRIPVELILCKLGEGASEAHLLDAYPGLTREDIQATMRYAGGG
jgi:uncharacterized protein (DUF433 family)